MAVARQSLASYRTAAQTQGADLDDIVKQLPILAKFLAFLGQTSDALSASQLAVDVYLTTVSPPWTNEKLQALTDLRQNVVARMVDLGDTQDAEVVARGALTDLGAGATLWWRQVIGHAAELSELSRQLAAGGSPVLSAAVLSAARNLVEAPPTAPAPPPPAGLPADALPAVTAGLSLKAEVRLLLDTTTDFADFLTGRGLLDVGKAAHNLTSTLTPSRFCGNPDNSDSSTHPLVFGPTKALWPSGPLQTSTSTRFDWDVGLTAVARWTLAECGAGRALRSSRGC